MRNAIDIRDLGDQVANYPHPFVNGAEMAQMKFQLVTLFGKVVRIHEGYFTMLTTDELLVSVTMYEPSGDDQSQLVQPDDSVEVQGLVKDTTVLQYGSLVKLEDDLDADAYERLMHCLHSEMCQ